MKLLCMSVAFFQISKTRPLNCKLKHLINCCAKAEYTFSSLYLVPTFCGLHVYMIKLVYCPMQYGVAMNWKTGV